DPPRGCGGSALEDSLDPPYEGAAWYANWNATSTGGVEALDVNGAQVFGVLCCLGFVLFVFLGFEVAVFRISCALCKVPQPGIVRTVGIVFLLLVVPAFVDGVFGGILIEAYEATEYPLWEAGLVQFFLALPVHMAICSAIHARTVGIRVGQGIAVWLVEKLLKLSLLVAIVGIVTVLVLAGPGK
ncbi:MAG TPA: hypothetical protein VM533_09270, partial [Fimbriiglobus sp.]|nr:hypothetical protein [Fimbriiglobus sp.]